MIKIHTLLAGVVISSVIAGLVQQPAFASPSSASGLSVSPAITNIQITAHQTAAKFNETITNPTNNLLSVSISVRDFGALNAYGSVGFYGANYKSSTNPHSLSSAITTPAGSFLIKPHQTKVIPIVIGNINQLSAGGHYSAILFTPVLTRSSSASNKVSAQPTIASLVFVITSSGGVETVKLGSFSYPSFGFSLPSTAYILLTDTGNTQIIPRGVLILKDPTSRIVAQSIINSNSGMILPATSRLFSVTLTTSDNLLKLAGVYQLQLRYQVNGASSYQLVTKRFFYLNPIVFVYIIIIALIYLGVHKLYKKPKHKIKRSHRLKNS